ncbi:hypothetical protein SLE2022_033580 [Rubroshorea leprosula]
MPGLTCNACNREFNDDAEQKLHYKSDWRRYNLKRKVGGVPGVTEALFLARQSALLEKNKQNETSMLDSCGKEYRSFQAYDQHLKSQSRHIMRGSQGTNQSKEEKVIIKPLPGRVVNKPTASREANGDESEDEWEEVDPEEELVEVASKSLTALNVDESASSNNMNTNGERKTVKMRRRNWIHHVVLCVI